MSEELGPCELQKTSLTRKGYAVRMVGGTTRYVHRLVYEEAYGPIPIGMFVCHKCDVRNCIRLDHLFLGTHKDNTQDMLSKGRQARGEASSRSKLTEAQVREVMQRRRAGERRKAIAASLGVSTDTITNITTGKTWAWLFAEPTSVGHTVVNFSGCIDCGRKH